MMTVIPDDQGAIKVSEVAVDQAQALLGTAASEDALTVVEQMRRVSTDALRRIALLLTSRNAVANNPGNVTWSGTTINLVSNTDIRLKLMQNEAPGGVIDLVLTYGPTNTATTFNSIALADGEVLFVEIDRANIASGPVVLQNAAGGGSVVDGLTVKKGAAGPILASPQTGAQGTISIPLAIRLDDAVWWIPHGIYWPPGTSSPLGAVLTTTNLPLGSITTYARMGTTYGLGPYGYSATKLLAPGYQLCNGSIVTDPLSPFRNPTRLDNGEPGVGFDPNQDVFTPQLCPPPAWNGGSAAYSEGDYVQNGGTQYVAIQAVPPATDISDTAFWVDSSVFNDTSISQPLNKYRCATANIFQHTFIRGSEDSGDANSGAAYGGANSQTHSHFMGNHFHNMSNHTHSLNNAAGQLAGGGGGGTDGVLWNQKSGWAGPTWTSNKRISGIGNTAGNQTGLFTGLSLIGTTDAPNTNNTSGPNNNAADDTSLDNQPRFWVGLYLVKIY